MFSKLSNNKGSTLVETLVVITISFVAVYAMTIFNTSLARHEVDTQEHMKLNAAIDNEIANLYNSNEEWRLKDGKIYSIESKGKETVLSTSYELTEHNTDKLTLEFNRGDYSKTYEIERSTYYE